MLRRFDLHMHSYYSADAANSPEELIAAAKAAGLDGIAITDHNSCGAYDELLGKGIARADGLAVDGFLVIPGVEVSTAEGHLLCFGATLPNLKGKPAREVAAAIRAKGGIAVPAHPFDRWRAGIAPGVMETFAPDAIEVFNAGVTSRIYNSQALAYAGAKALPMIAGSDAHHASAVGTATMTYDLEELSVAGVLAAIRSGGERQERYLSRLEGLKKHLGNWFRFINRRPMPAPSD